MTARRWWTGRRFLRWASAPPMTAVLAVPLGVAAFLSVQASPALTEVGLTRFVTDSAWRPGADQFGAAPMLAGTVVSSLLATLVFAPAAVAWAIRVNTFASAGVAQVERTVVATLAGVPSVVIGLVGLIALVPVIRQVQPPGLSLLATMVVLAAMSFPTAATAADAAIQQVDPELGLAARALGLGPWDTLRVAILPAAKNGLITSCLLGLGRALGETLAVMLVAGNTIAWPSSLFAPFRTLNGNIAVEMAYSAGIHRSALFTTGLVLLGLVLSSVALQTVVLSRRRLG